MAKYLVMLSDGTKHKGHSLKRAATLSGGTSFIAQKVGRGGKRGRPPRRYKVLGKMVHCGPKEVR